MDIDWQNIASEALDRDPRKFPIGIYTGGSFVLDGVRVFSWLKDIDELAFFIREVEPRIYDIESDEELAAYQGQIQPIIERIYREGLTDSLRQELSDATSSFLAIDWWGTFFDLCNGNEDFAEELRSRLRDDEDGRPITEDEMEDFIFLLKDCGC